MNLCGHRINRGRGPSPCPQGAAGDHDVRPAFRGPARTAHDIAIGVHELAGRSPFGSDLP